MQGLILGLKWPMGVLEVETPSGSVMKHHTTAQRLALPAENGLIVYDSTLGSYFKYEAGAWVPLVSVSNKSHFFEAETNSAFQTFRVRSVSGTGQWNFIFRVPKDFNSVSKVSLEYVVDSAGAPGTGKDIDITANYGAAGEPYNQHSASDTTSTYTIPAQNRFGSLDITILFSNLAANDNVGIETDHNTIGGSIAYLGVLIEYN
jgi:hypothetical protein